MCRDGGVFLAQAARRRVARVGERRAAVGLGRLVQHGEADLGHVHLAAQLHGGRRVRELPRERALPQAQRHVAHRAHVGGHVLARGAVAARGGPHKAAVLVGEGNGRAVDLELAHHRDHVAEGLLHTVEPGVQLAQVHGVVERVHAALVAHRRELLPHVPADALRGAGRVHQVRVGGLQLAQLAHERVERAVGNLGSVLGIVQIAVMLYLAPQLLDARLGIAGRARERALVQQRLLFVRHVCHRRRFLPKGTRAPATQEPSCFLGNSTTSLRKAASSTHLSPLHRTECRSRLLSRQHPRGALPAHRPCARHFAARATP